MSRTLRRLGLVIVAAGALLPASNARATPPPAPPAGLGVTLLEGPADRIDDPRAHSYIVDHLAPGTTITRKIGFSNGDAHPIDVVFYAAAADLDDETFVVAPDRAENELTSWVGFSADTATLQPGETLPVTVTITVPADATRGERYAAALAATLPSTAGGGQMATVSRAGIRIYLSVGAGGEPITAFGVDAMTAGRNTDGHPIVAADVRNTGERAIDLSGSLQLDNGPGSLSAGPFDAQTSSTLAPGASGHVEIILDDGLPLGPWDATISLTSGMITESATAQLTFPARVGVASPTPAVAATDEGAFPLVALLAGAAGALALAAFVTFAIGRRRRATPPAGHLTSTPVASDVASSGTSNSRDRRPSRPRRSRVIAAVLVIAGFAFNAPRTNAAADAPVALGRAGAFSVLSGAGVTSTGATVMSANLGANTASSVVGFPPGVVHGNTHLGDTTSSEALTDLNSAYNDAAGRSTTNTLVAGDLNGRTFTPGVYRADAAIALTGTVTLDAGGQRNAVFVFQLGAAFNPAAGSIVNLVGGASSSNVFWQVVGETTIGASASVAGTILTTAAVTIGANATLTGRVLSTNGIITLATNSIVTPPVITIAGGPVASTNETAPTITGTTDAPAGTTVTVTFAGQTMTATVDDTGTWTVPTAPVPNGSYSVSATVTGPWGNTSTAHQMLTIGGVTPVALGRAGTFSVLSGAGGAAVTSTGATVLDADLGANTATSVAETPTIVVKGIRHVGDTTSSEALGDLTLAYNDAASRSTANVLLAGDLNGRTFSPGVYRANVAIALTGTVILDAGGQRDAVFVFQLGAAFNPAASSQIILADGATASNVFWQVAGATTIGASASISGTIMTTAAITIGDSASLDGRALSTNGAITLAANTITAAASPGTLSITTSATAVDLGTFDRQAGGGTISGRLGPVNVADTRSGSSGAGWVASVSATAFTPLSGPAIPATSITYNPVPVTEIRGEVVSHDVNILDDLTGITPVVAAVGASNNNAAYTTWNPIISVEVPDTAVSGIYTSIVTHTVS